MDTLTNWNELSILERKKRAFKAWNNFRAETGMNKYEICQHIEKKYRCGKISHSSFHRFLYGEMPYMFRPKKRAALNKWVEDNK